MASLNLTYPAAWAQSHLPSGMGSISLIQQHGLNPTLTQLYGLNIALTQQHGLDLQHVVPVEHLGVEDVPQSEEDFLVGDH